MPLKSDLPLLWGKGLKVRQTQQNYKLDTHWHMYSQVNTKQVCIRPYDKILLRLARVFSLQGVGLKVTLCPICMITSWVHIGTCTCKHIIYSLKVPCIHMNIRISYSGLRGSGVSSLTIRLNSKGGYGSYHAQNAWLRVGYTLIHVLANK